MVSRCFPGDVLGGRCKVELTEVLQKKCANFPTHSSCSSPGMLHLSQALLMKVRKVLTGAIASRACRRQPAEVLWALDLLSLTFSYSCFLSAGLSSHPEIVLSRFVFPFAGERICVID